MFGCAANGTQLQWGSKLPPPFMAWFCRFLHPFGRLLCIG
jgi:hypothetical protein